MNFLCPNGVNVKWAGLCGGMSTLLAESAIITKFHSYSHDFVSCRPWLPPVAGFDSEKLSCYRVVDAGQDGYVTGLAEEILTSKERQEWRYFGKHERRRRQWLLGRWAAKKAVCALLDEEHLEPLDVEIFADENGKPMVGGASRETRDTHVSISIAHSGESIVAVAGGFGRFQGVGVDIEPLNRDCEQIKALILNSEEQLLIPRVFPRNRDEEALKCWCAKEAVAKALGVGMLGGPRNLIIEDIDFDMRRMWVSLRGKMAEEAPAFRDSFIPVFTGSADGLVYATSVVKKS